MKTLLQIFLALVERQRGLLGQARMYEWSLEMHSRWGLLWLVGVILMMLLFWGIFFVGLFVSVRWMLGKGRRKTPDRALEILRQRYAQGEITKEEFEAKRSDLR